MRRIRHVPQVDPAPHVLHAPPLAVAGLDDPHVRGPGAPREADAAAHGPARRVVLALDEVLVQEAGAFEPGCQHPRGAHHRASRAGRHGRLAPHREELPGGRRVRLRRGGRRRERAAHRAAQGEELHDPAAGDLEVGEEPPPLGAPQPVGGRVRHPALQVQGRTAHPAAPPPAGRPPPSPRRPRRPAAPRPPRAGPRPPRLRPSPRHPRPPPAGPFRSAGVGARGPPLRPSPAPGSAPLIQRALPPPPAPFAHIRRRGLPQQTPHSSPPPGSSSPPPALHNP